MKLTTNIVKDETVEAIAYCYPSLARKLTTLEKKLDICWCSELSIEDCFSHAFFATLGLLGYELEIEKVDETENYIQMSVEFNWNTLEGIKIFVNFSKD